MDLPISRMRQITTTISRRIEDTEKLKRTYIEWQTRTLAGVMVSTAQIDEAAHKSLSGLIGNISMEGDDEANVVQVKDSGGVVVEADPYAYIDEDPTAALDRALAKNGPGSFERFMASARGG